MYDGNYYRMMADYNRWMNQSIFASCNRLSEHQRRQDMGAFFQSIHGTLDHILYGDKAWMGRFVNEPFTVTTIGQLLYDDFAELRAEREREDQRIADWAQSLSDQWLQEPFIYTSNVDKQERCAPAWVLVTHMFNHQTHHRGQVTTLLSQLGVDPGVTDIPWLPALNTLGTSD